MYNYNAFFINYMALLESKPEVIHEKLQPWNLAVSSGLIQVADI